MLTVVSLYSSCSHNRTGLTVILTLVTLSQHSNELDLEYWTTHTARYDSFYFPTLTVITRPATFEFKVIKYSQVLAQISIFKIIPVDSSSYSIVVQPL